MHRIQTAAAVAAAVFAPAVLAAVQTFDTPTADSAQTLAVYGLASVANVTSATVVDGELRLDATGGLNGDVGFVSPTADFSFAFDTRISTTPGYVNVGFSVGDRHVFFHPGYWDNVFIDAVLAGNMGFTPDWEQMTHVAVDVDLTTNTFSFTLSQGSHSYDGSLVVADFIPGVTRVGFTAGSVEGLLYYGVFDNLEVSAVPEPAAGALLLAGLGCLGGRMRRRA